MTIRISNLKECYDDTMSVASSGVCWPGQQRESHVCSIKAEFMYEAQFHSILCIKEHYVTETYWQMLWRPYATIN